MKTPPTAIKRRQYGSGSISQRATDGLWIGTIEAGWTARGTRRRIRVTAHTKTECAAKLKAKKREVDSSGGAPAAGSGRMSVKAWADEWLTIIEREVRPSTFKSHAAATRKWIIPAIGHRTLGALTPADLRALAQMQRDAKPPLSHASITRTHNVARAMLRSAVNDGGHTVPAITLAMKPLKQPDFGAGSDRRRAIPPHHAAALMAAAGRQPDGSRWLVAFLHGIRQGETLGLTWDHVDLLAGIATIEWQLQPIPWADRAKGTRRVPDGFDYRPLHGAHCLVAPKTKRSIRAVPLAPIVVDALRLWRAAAPDSPYGLVWPNPDGNPRDKGSDIEDFQALQRFADVRHETGRYYHVHEARHFAATAWMKSGVPDKVIQALMGHSSALTSQLYQDADAEAKRAAVTAMTAHLQLGPAAK